MSVTVLSLLGACRDKGPTPKPAASSPTVAGEVDAVDLGAITIKAPPKWKFEHPSSSMRRAQFAVAGSGGDAGLVVYFFGNQGAGTVKANTDRWIGQFKNPDGSAIGDAKPVERTVAGFKTTQLEVTGTYVGGMTPGAPPQGETPGQRLIATIVNTPAGPYYFKFLGPDKTVNENRATYDKLLESMTSSE